MSPSEKKARESAPVDPSYTVTLRRGVAKSLLSAPALACDIFGLLREELALEGPIQVEWPCFGTLNGQTGQKRSEKRFYCHIKKGLPTYVVCWSFQNKRIEIYYVGTHGNAPYWGKVSSSSRLYPVAQQIRSAASKG